MWVKVCGVRDVATAQSVAGCLPDAIGLNFYPRSSRAITAETAARIVTALPESIEPVGVFVNATVADVVQTVGRCGLRRVQFHGDETPAQIAEFHQECPGVGVVKAWRCDSSGLADLRSFVEDCAARGASVSAVLLDASVPGAYGGTGMVLPWNELQRDVAALPVPVILAGGLTAENVGLAVQALHPWGVDVASGVETAPGVKDANLVARFIEAARANAS